MIEQILLAVLGGVLTTMIMLPITSDTLRSKFFGNKAKKQLLAQKELTDVIREMIFSGQRVKNSVYKKIAESTAKKYQTNLSSFDKNDIISSLLQQVNTSDILSGYTKRLLSERLKREYSENEDEISLNGQDDEDDERFARDIGSLALTQWREHTEQFRDEYITYDVKGNKLLLCSLVCSLCVGVIVGEVLYFAHSFLMLQSVIGLFSFLMCVNILVSLIDVNTIKDINYFRRMVYKLILIMVLSVVGILLTALYV